MQICTLLEGNCTDTGGGLDSPLTLLYFYANSTYLTPPLAHIPCGSMILLLSLLAFVHEQTACCYKPSPAIKRQNTQRHSLYLGMKSEAPCFAHPEVKKWSQI